MRTEKKSVYKPVDPAVFKALDHQRNLYESVHTDSMRNTDIGHWVNEAFDVRLWAVMEEHRVVGSKKINKTLPGADEVNCCRLIRNQIAHSTADVNSERALKVDHEIRRVFKLGQDESLIDGKFILSKDTVLRPMWKVCRYYALALIEEEKGTT